MDGTLFDSAQAVPDAFMTTIARLDGPHLTPADIVATYSLGPPATILGHFLGRSARQGDLDLYHAMLADRASDVRPYPGVREALDALSNRLPLAVFTGASREAAETLLSATRLRGFFAEVVGGDEVPRPKPYPDGLEEVSRRLSVLASDTAYIGDAPVDLEAAIRAGALAVAASWGHMYQPESARRADIVLDLPEDAAALLIPRDDFNGSRATGNA